MAGGFNRATHLHRSTMLLGSPSSLAKSCSFSRSVRREAIFSKSIRIGVSIYVADCVPSCTLRQWCHVWFFDQTVSYHSYPSLQRIGLPWNSNILPLRYAAEFCVAMGYYTVARSAPFYLVVVILASECASPQRGGPAAARPDVAPPPRAPAQSCGLPRSSSAPSGPSLSSRTPASRTCAPCAPCD